MHEADFGRVALAVEHALAEERALEPNAIQPAHEPAVAPSLDRVAMAPAKQFAIEPPDAAVDPGIAAAGRRRGAGVDHRLEIVVDPDFEPVRAHGPRQPPRHMKTIEREHAAPLRLDPVETWIVGAFRHRKDAAGISLQQHLGRDLDSGVVAASHWFRGQF